MDSIICPSCDEETYVYCVGKIGRWEWIKCEACHKNHWRQFNGTNELELREINRGVLYAAIDRDQKKS